MLPRNRAPNLSSVRRCGALETWPRSQYSPRPPESGLKKSPDVKPDQQANLSRRWQAPRHSNPPLNRPLLSRRAGVFLLFESLGSALAISTKLTDWMIFYRYGKRRHTRASTLKK
jgi:hypothetical protein